MENQIGYYAIIPANVRYDKNLPANAKLLYGEITALCNEKGFCWATNEYFAKLYDVSKVSISKWISALIDGGYITSEIIYKDGSKQILNRYLRIVTHPIKEKFNTPIKENFAYNNTNNNNTINKKETYKEKFETFYKAYPRKVGKANVEKWFNKNKPDDKLFELMMRKLEIFKKSPDWFKDNGQFIPYPTTWLNQKRWEDEIVVNGMDVFEENYDVFKENTMSEEDYIRKVENGGRRYV